ncbi:MAG TPA: bifunctional serine/threonine-protein kinase/universal stress protein [Anaeromyxobacteraceae bacterium]|nr:bifunctional serine/threonine-protein kinase/universal stress protein [Anaeromyxobacteraceae bacterium]
MGRLPEVGEGLDGYRITGKLHSGGMGVLLTVEPAEELGFPLVMKIPRLGYGEPAEAVVSYEVEQLVLSVLKGPHVPRFVAAGDLAATPYIVMELVEGECLKERVERIPLPPEEVADVGAAVATALRAIHQQEVVHLDVKPSNIILRPTGEAVFVDFGLAHHAHYPDLLAEESRAPMGSAPYISPEQVLGVRSDPRSDLFALGAMLYELATGKLPFGSPTGPSGLRKRLYTEPVPPRAIRKEIPEWLQEIILHLLEPDANQRYATAAQVAFDLTHADQVVVTERGQRLERAGLGTRFRRWFKAKGMEPAAVVRPSAQLANARIVLAAVATAHTNEALFQAQRDAVRRLLAADPGSRLACVTVVKPASVAGAETEDDVATTQAIKNLVHLRHWAEPLQLDPATVSFHALEGSDPAATVLAYARANAVDQIVIGAPPPDLPLRALMGTFATKIAAEAPCTVTLVRPPAPGRDHGTVG